ncbi:hypothetical protein L0128_03305 [candidate division KSB1 bacterium]|nr:hypothetical protein [candidate division KSB1 bacterium]
MAHQPQFHYQPTGPASARIWDAQQCIAEIRNLTLCQVRFRPEGQILLGAEVPLPLYWRQYCRQHDPEFHARSNPCLTWHNGAAQELYFTATGVNISRRIQSEYQVRLTYSATLQSYVFQLQATLHVAPGYNWELQPNPDHGEIEFCNFWPAHCFTTQPAQPKQFQACYLQNPAGIRRIPHHHLESSDKKNLRLTAGSRFYWLLEEENPVIEIISEPPITGGLCAYMWDLHLGYRSAQGACLPGNTTLFAAFRLYAIDSASARLICAQAITPEVPEIATTPIVETGVNTFRKGISDFPTEFSQIWPWSFEILADAAAARLYWDRQLGYDDAGSLAIENYQAITSRWLATTLGPAFGQAAFPAGARFRLSAFVRTQAVAGRTTVAIRLHRSGVGSVFQLTDYEIYASTVGCTGDTDWRAVSVLTPVISPAPDRLHLILEQTGQGRSWFDNVVYEIIPPDEMESDLNKIAA